LNLIFPELQLKTQGISGWSGKGLHTTTFAEMFDLPFGGSVIDTPGMRGIWLGGRDQAGTFSLFPGNERTVSGLPVQ
jgi:ribosome biogenesis GTPase